MAKAFPNTGVTIIDSSSDLTGFSPSEGLMVFQKDTNELKIYDGANWRSVIDTDTPMGLIMMQPTSVSNATNNNGLISFSNVTSFSVNGIFSSAYNSYRILINANTTSGGNTDCSLRWRVNGVDDTSNNYTRQTFNVDHTTMSASRGTSTLAGISWLANSNLPTLCVADVINVAQATQTNILPISNISYLGSYISIYNVIHNVNTAYDGFTMFPASGNFSGTVRVYAYRESI